VSLAAKFVVEWVPKRLADDFVSRRHYSGSAVWASHTHLAVRDADGMVHGVLQFGPSMNPRATSKVIEGLDPRALVELNRMVFVDNHEPNLPSWSIAQAVYMIRKDRPHVHVVQSFADERCGKLGAVYQASNFIYLGSHRTEFYYLDGEWFHRSLLGRAEKDNRGWGRGPKAERLAAGRHRAERHEFEQFRYVLPLTRWARRKLAGRALPYPKGNCRKVELPLACATAVPSSEQLELFKWHRG
jgi:hypothetical protein